MGSTDAVNEPYVDSAVASVEAGSFVSKNGDAMAGPPMLPGEKNDIRRSVYARLVNAAIAMAISAAIALHDHFGSK